MLIFSAMTFSVPSALWLRDCPSSPHGSTFAFPRFNIEQNACFDSFLLEIVRRMLLFASGIRFPWPAATFDTTLREFACRFSTAHTFGQDCSSQYSPQ